MPGRMTSMRWFSHSKPGNSSMIRILVASICCVSLFSVCLVSGPAAAGSLDAFNNVRRATEFADHVEDGVDAAQTVNRTRKIANVATGGLGGAVVGKTVEEVVGNQVEDVARDEFRDFVEDEVGDQVFDSVRGNARGKVRKQLIR